MMSSLGVHDIGGLEEEFGPVDTREYGFQLWEMKVMNVVLMFMLSSPMYSGSCNSDIVDAARSDVH